MDRIEWQDAYLVGIALIDYQHKKLFDLANLFFETIDAVKIQDLTESMLNGLTLYARTHFTAEEAHMHTIDYPERTAHQAQHRAFVRQIEVLTERRKAQQAVDFTEAAEFVKNWLTCHIRIEDKKIGVYTNQNTVKTGSNNCF